MNVTITINGRARELRCAPGDTLLTVLRASGYTSVKQGCDCEGTCGACTVLLDGTPVLACITPAPTAHTREVVTVEGLGDPSRPHALQRAFVEAGAVQCGFCTPGMLLAAKALLDRHPAPSEDQIKDALSNNLCRCTGYVKILEGVRRGAELLASEAVKKPAATPKVKRAVKAVAKTAARAASRGATKKKSARSRS